MADTGTYIPAVPLQFLDNNGDPIAGKLFTYEAGTATKVATYTDSAVSVANTNPIVLDSAGRATVFLKISLGSVKLVLAPSTDTDPPVSPIWTRDNINPIPATSLSTTIIRVGTAGALTESDNILSLTLPYSPTIVSSYGWNSATGTDPISLPAGTLGANGEGLILEWEADYSSATLSARATMFGANYDLGTGGATTQTRARYQVYRTSATALDISQTVIQSTAIATAHTTATSLDLDNSSYSIAMTMASGTFTVRGARVFHLKAIPQWAT
jgi:hypothetical protein